MPYEEPDTSDPHELIGVVLPADAQAMREMACVFAEEFARMGYDAARILRLFEDPHYAGANGAYRALGRETTTAIIAESISVWGRVRWIDREPQ